MGKIISLKKRQGQELLVGPYPVLPRATGVSEMELPAEELGGEHRPLHTLAHCIFSSFCYVHFAKGGCVTRGV